MSWHQTTWQFVSSQGGEITAGEGLNVGGGGGSFFLKDGRTRNRLELPYGVLTAGVGAGSPINIDFCTREMESGGVGNIWARDRHYLHPEDFSGLCVIGNLQYAGIFEGKAISLVFFDVPVLTSIEMGVPIPGTVFSAKAAGVIWGRNVGIEMGAAAMFYVGFIDVLDVGRRRPAAFPGLSQPLSPPRMPGDSERQHGRTVFY
jgi:hypothetical protein